MKNSYKKILLFMTVAIIAVMCTLISASAASESDLTFVLNDDGNGYTVTAHNNYISGSLTIPSSYNGKPITSIGDYAFEDCAGLTNVIIPDSIVTIGFRAFSSCRNISKLIIPDSVTAIDGQAFYGCTILSGITIPDGVTSIGYEAFRFCYALKNITIPDSVTKIGESTFNSCTSLAVITIPDSVTNIGKDAFYNTAYYNTSSNWKNGILYIGNHLIKATNSITSCNIRQGTKTIGAYAFENCTNLESITIPDSVLSISHNAFHNCRGLTSISIPDSVTNIGYEAFYNCTGFTEFTVPKSVTSVDFGAFHGCTSLTKITLPFIGVRQNGTGDTTLSHIFDNNIPKSLKEVIITAPCKTIGSSAFEDCTGLTGITIPDSVTSIDQSAFEGCTGLTDITIPDSVTSIGDRAFYNCTGFTSFTVPESVTSIGYGAFAECSNLTSITLPFIGSSSYNDTDITHFGYIFDEFYYYGEDNRCVPESLESVIITEPCKIIAPNAFKDCTHLKSITIPETVTSIGYEAFYNTAFYNDRSNWENNLLYLGKNLIKASGTITSCNIRNDTRIIAMAAFEGCSKLKSILIPDKVVSIGADAFGYCLNLKSIIIPASLTYVGSGAFYCTDLKYIFYKGSETQKKNIRIDSYGNDSFISDAVWHYRTTGHTYKTVITKATLSKNGKSEIKCTVCGHISKTTTIYRPKNITLSATSYNYDGKVKTPKVTVKNSKGKVLVKNTDYTVSAEKGRKNIGTYTVTVTFKGNYSGTKKLTFTIKPKITKKITATQTISSIKLSWSKVTGATGYRVYKYNKNSDKYVKFKDVKKNSLTISELNEGSKYKYKVRAYTKKNNNTTIWGDCSKVFVTATKPETPSLGATSTQKGTATLSWTNVSGESGYQIYYSKNKDHRYQKAGTVKADTSKVVLANLVNGKTYYFRVRAYIKLSSGNVYSGYKTVSVKLQQAPVLTNEQAHNIWYTANQIYGKWNIPCNRNEYINSDKIYEIDGKRHYKVESKSIKTKADLKNYLKNYFDVKTCEKLTYSYIDYKGGLYTSRVGGIGGLFDRPIKATVKRQGYNTAVISLLLLHYEFDSPNTYIRQNFYVTYENGRWVFNQPFIWNPGQLL